MKAKLIKVIERKGSSNGATRCYILCFKGEDGKSYRSWTDERLGNFTRWYNAICGLITAEKANQELWLDGLIVRKGRPGEIDADSLFKIELVESLKPRVIEEFLDTRSASKEKPRRDLE